ncbi:DUF177 domain-containing protein [Thalassobius sp. I31.1]|uniref:YceD family protein n=1 Tax=Thalassobius sp. I31.1 TaxID=2109912 RepID=UPI000D1B3B44|nr:DUF177 domain-containing protein [Thalassobius sp. I31.1]
MNDTAQQPPYSHSYETRALKSSQELTFELKPDVADCAPIAEILGLISLNKLRFKGTIKAAGKKDWVVTAELGATIEQPCISTLAPVKTRIDEKVTRRFIANYETPDEDSETEMDPDETQEPLGATIDVGEIMTEALALALPLYPRAAGADTESAPIQAAPKGVAPLQDADLNPFSALQGLKNKIQNGDSGES